MPHRLAAPGTRRRQDRARRPGTAASAGRQGRAPRAAVGRWPRPAPAPRADAPVPRGLVPDRGERCRTPAARAGRGTGSRGRSPPWRETGTAAHRSGAPCRATSTRPTPPTGTTTASARNRPATPSAGWPRMPARAGDGVRRGRSRGGSLPGPPVGTAGGVDVQPLPKDRHDAASSSRVVPWGGASCSSAAATSASPIRSRRGTPGGRPGGHSSGGRPPACCRATRRSGARPRRRCAGSRWSSSPGWSASERAVGEHGPGPGPEVLRRDVLAGDLAEVVVHVLRAGRRGPRPPRRRTGSSSWPGQVLAARDDAGRGAGRATSTSCCTPLLPRNRNRTLLAAHLRVAVAQRRQPERAVEPRVLVVADADQRQLEQPDDRPRAPSRAAGPRRAEVRVDPPPDRGSSAREAAPCGRTSARSRDGAIARVVAVLLAPPRVAAGGLEVAARFRADPHVASTPAGRRATGSARASSRSRTTVPVGIAVGEATPGAAAGDPGSGVRAPAKARVAGGLAAGGQVDGHGAAPLGAGVTCRAFQPRRPRAPPGGWPRGSRLRCKVGPPPRRRHPQRRRRRRWRPRRGAQTASAPVRRTACPPSPNPSISLARRKPRPRGRGGRIRHRPRGAGRDDPGHRRAVGGGQDDHDPDDHGRPRPDRGRGAGPGPRPAAVPARDPRAHRLHAAAVHPLPRPDRGRERRLRREPLRDAASAATTPRRARS